MEETLRDFLNWYLAPWRRIGRREFGIGLTLVTLPGLFVMIFGWGGSAGHYISPLLDLLAGGPVQPGLLDSLMGGAAEEPAFAIDWTAALNSVLLLALVPLCRMRLRDMGWFGWQEVVLTVVFNLSVAGGLVQAVSGYDVLPWRTVWGIANFAGYGWMAFARGQPRGSVHERTDYDKAGVPDRKSDDEY